jgi:transposase
LPIDNGLIERIHRGPAVTRRAYLFAGSHAGAERASIAYSILATCALVGVSPVHYLADVLPKLVRGVFTRADLAELLPAAWKHAREAVAVATPPPE